MAGGVLENLLPTRWSYDANTHAAGFLVDSATLEYTEADAATLAARATSITGPTTTDTADVYVTVDGVQTLLFSGLVRDWDMVEGPDGKTKMAVTVMDQRVLLLDTYIPGGLFAYGIEQDPVTGRQQFRVTALQAIQVLGALAGLAIDVSGVPDYPLARAVSGSGRTTIASAITRVMRLYQFVRQARVDFIRTGPNSYALRQRPVPLDLSGAISVPRAAMRLAHYHKSYVPRVTATRVTGTGGLGYNTCFPSRAARDLLSARVSSNGTLTANPLPVTDPCEIVVQYETTTAAPYSAYDQYGRVTSEGTIYTTSVGAQVIQVLKEGTVTVYPVTPPGDYDAATYGPWDPRQAAGLTKVCRTLSAPQIDQYGRHIGQLDSDYGADMYQPPPGKSKADYPAAVLAQLIGNGLVHRKTSTTYYDAPPPLGKETMVVETEEQLVFTDPITQAPLTTDPYTQVANPKYDPNQPTSPTNQPYMPLPLALPPAPTLSMPTPPAPGQTGWGVDLDTMGNVIGYTKVVTAPPPPPVGAFLTSRLTTTWLRPTTGGATIKQTEHWEMGSDGTLYMVDSQTAIQPGDMRAVGRQGTQSLVRQAVASGDHGIDATGAGVFTATAGQAGLGVFAAHEPLIGDPATADMVADWAQAQGGQWLTELEVEMPIDPTIQPHTVIQCTGGTLMDVSAFFVTHVHVEDSGTGLQRVTGEVWTAAPSEGEYGILTSRGGFAFEGAIFTGPTAVFQTPTGRELEFEHGIVTAVNADGTIQAFVQEEGVTYPSIELRGNGPTSYPLGVGDQVIIERDGILMFALA